MDAHALDQRPIATHGGEWMVSLASWVIQDGNYGDFEVGTSRRFAIEFWADDLQPSSRTTRTAASVGGSRYAINANLAYVGDDLVMLDIGLVAYREVRANPKFPSPWVQGFISLGIDPFSYFETHARRRGVPPAIYGWDITGIWHETAPWISSEVTGFGRSMVRDPEKLGWAWLDRTDAWADDNGNAEYLVRCRANSSPPTRDIGAR